mmetsp:Transcript_26476/g.47529  ORF Transcript_26476/g.47529 Transcript_26476/m.47529 type:complete len:253 (+) Transcript_26476:1538-2296(+)
MELWKPALIALPANTVVFLIAQALGDNSIVDVAWGQLFLLELISAHYAAPNFNIRAVLATLIVALWSIRLSWHIYKRHAGEDYRYVYLRREWMKKGKLFYYIASFGFVFVLQAVLSIVNNSSVLYIVLHSNTSLAQLDYIGLGVWLLGFYIESQSDYQLQEFRKLKDRPAVMKTGLWSISRHPNYFGEAVQWWGLYILSCSVEGGWTTVVSALTITLLLRYVSGVPPLERKLMKKPEYQQYAKETSVFVPFI